MNKRCRSLWEVALMSFSLQMRTHFPFSIQGLIFLSGEWMRKSPFSLSSMNAFIASIDLLRGHLSILAWNLMLAICRLRLSLSMLLLVELLELESKLLEKAGGPGLSTPH